MVGFGFNALPGSSKSRPRLDLSGVGVGFRCLGWGKRVVIRKHYERRLDLRSELSRGQAVRDPRFDVGTGRWQPRCYLSGDEEPAASESWNINVRGKEMVG